MKILSASQIREWDQYTIKQEPIASIDLMERAALCFVDWFVSQYESTEGTIKVFCGPGNNGGDGLAIARLLHYRFYEVEVFICKIGNTTSKDFDLNLHQLPADKGVILRELQAGAPLPLLPSKAIIIDALFGSGLNRPLKGYWASLVEHINALGSKIIAVDIPSGLFADQATLGTAIQATQTFSFQCPKLAFLFPQNHLNVGQLEVRSIGLHQGFLENINSPYYFTNQLFIKDILKQRSKFDHKGTYGHALLIMGSYGKIGAAILATRAALRSGTGLVTIHAPQKAYEILQISVPEAMVSVDPHTFLFSQSPSIEGYKSIGVGCGLGTNEITFEGLAKLMVDCPLPLVLDADALNLISLHPALFSVIPTNSILTPHPKEFERLFGASEDNFARNKLQLEKAKELNCYILLKGANTAIACPDGNCYFNSTGNPGMATAGSGDVLTGILTGLLAQGYDSKEACILGAYLHGLAGDIATSELGSMEALIAGDIIDFLGKAYQAIQEV